MITRVSLSLIEELLLHLKSIHLSIIDLINFETMLSTRWSAIGRDQTFLQPLNSLRPFSSCCINYLPNAKQYARIEANPEKYKQRLLDDLARKHHRYKQDPEWRRKKIDEAALRNAQYRLTKESYNRSQSLYNWIIHHTWFREDLPWKSHKALLFPQKIESKCSSCGQIRNNGAKLWWKSLASDDFTCHNCS